MVLARILKKKKSKLTYRHIKTLSSVSSNPYQAQPPPIPIEIPINHPLPLSSPPPILFSVIPLTIINTGPNDWKTAKAYCKSGETFEGQVEGFNGGGLLIRFQSLLGFLPYPQLSPSRSCKEPQKSIHEIAKTLVGSTLPVKVVQADEENRKLILSEKLALWPKYSQNVNVGDVFDDGLYHLTGLVHVSEVLRNFEQPAEWPISSSAAIFQDKRPCNCFCK